MGQLAVQGRHQVGDLGPLSAAHARHRLVKQQQPGLHGERSSQLDAFLHPVGQGADASVGDGGGADEGQCLHCGVAVLALLPAGPPQV